VATSPKYTQLFLGLSSFFINRENNNNSAKFVFSFRMMAITDEILALST
jgi:hypothetical protein